MSLKVAVATSVFVPGAPWSGWTMNLVKHPWTPFFEALDYGPSKKSVEPFYMLREGRGPSAGH